MVCVFASFVPHGDASVKPIAFGLAVGVLVDAFLVRMTLVPAVLALLGERAWWLPRLARRRAAGPGRRGRGRRQHLEHEEWVAEHGAAVVRAEGLTLPRRRRRRSSLDVDLVVRPGQLVAVLHRRPGRPPSPAEPLAGRLAAPAGTVVVLDRMLPAEAAAVRRSVALHEVFPASAGLAGHPPAAWWSTTSTTSPPRTSTRPLGRLVALAGTGRPSSPAAGAPPRARRPCSTSTPTRTEETSL